MEKLDDALQPVAVPSDDLPPNLHNHLSALLTMKKKHKMATVVYLHASQVQAMLWALDSLVFSLAPSVPSMTPGKRGALHKYRIIIIMLILIYHRTLLNGIFMTFVLNALLPQR